MPAIEAEIRRDAGDPDIWGIKMRALAVLGERELAFDALRKAISAESTRYSEDWSPEFRRRELPALLALLGETEAAIDEIATLVKLPGFFTQELQGDIMAVPLWEHEKFRALMKDPTSNAPIPFDSPVRYQPKVRI